MNGQISGFFLSFPETECEEIRGALSDLGYSMDNEGLKKWIVDSLLSDEESEDPPGGDTSGGRGRMWEQLNNYIANHPEEVAGFMELGRTALSKLQKKTAK